MNVCEIVILLLYSVKILS